MVPGGFDIVIVVATVFVGLAVAAALSAWADRRFPGRALIVLGLALGTFAWVQMRVPGGLTAGMIPESFILVVARIVN